MIDIDAQITKMISALPDIPAAVLPKDMCDKPFMSPQGPAHYVLKTIGGTPDFIMKIGSRPHPDTSRYGCSNSIHVVPHRNVAVVNAGDVGAPGILMFRPGTKTLPKELLLKNTAMPGDHWHKFIPSKGHMDAQGNLIVTEYPRAPHAYPYNYNSVVNDITKANKQWGVEFLGFVGPQKA